ncbi:hypothetical protein NC653_019735 [Populus alba x Populus x berolinensis]|uniref:Histone-lysine N-methyltransferase ASHH3 n=1 Tax=Populus alba x Populus x berolinensis TaxID=444605 RepID=A0AAD6QJU1_9ROSI|nr:hypothetical protein NC653_019735 [Populus alba x Populus x berolinensis]
MGLNSIQPMPMPMPMVHGIRFLTSQENLTFNCYNTGGCTLYYYTQQEKKSKRKENSNKNKICSLDFSRYSVLYILYSEQLCYLKPCLLRRSFSSPNTVCCTTAAIFSSDLDQRITLAFNKLLKDIGNQVEFELPDSFNKSKSTAYTLIKRSIHSKYVKFLKPFYGVLGSLFLSVSSCMSIYACMNLPRLLFLINTFKIYISLRRLKGALKTMAYSAPAVHHRVPLVCVIEIAIAGCKCGSSCSNKPFQQRQVKKMKLVQTEKCGSGIVADEDIKQGEFVIEYVGEVIDDKTCEERLWKMKHCGETNFYLCEINRDMVIDATYKGNKSRYINHSCSPNTEMQKWCSTDPYSSLIIDGETRIGIFATRDIRKGEHLTYDYQFVQFGADQDCHCGSSGCRKKLGVKPSKPKISSDAALKLVACQVAVSSPKLKAMMSGKDVYQNGDLHMGSSQRALSSLPTYSCNCIGEVVRLSCHTDKTYFGIIKRYDKYSRKHSIMFEDGTVKFLDMSKEDWDFVTS